jgi:hypothetical protein
MPGHRVAEMASYLASLTGLWRWVGGSGGEWVGAGLAVVRY